MMPRHHYNEPNQRRERVMSSSESRTKARERRRMLGEETLEIQQRGSYLAKGGGEVDLTAQLAACRAGTRLYLADELELLVAGQERLPERAGRCEVRAQSTLEAARELVESGRHARVGALNFASARNPGGGFLSGAQAQEESLARSSGLYTSQLECQEDFYDFNRRQKTLLYSDRMILSPACPVFRDDEGALLDAPYGVDIVTSPAPNLGAIRQNRTGEERQVSEVLRRRGRYLLALFAHRGCEAIVLGAWGCGVFGNSPEVVAQVFATLLEEERWQRCFEEVRFAIYEPSGAGATLNSFEAQLGGKSGG